MKLKVISSGSVGNCYILEASDIALLIECGVKFSEIKQAVNFDLMKIQGCVVTHEHGDHARSISQVMQIGVPVVASKGTFEALKIDEYRGNVSIKHGQKTNIGGFQVSALSVEHDAKEPLAFLIEHEECGRVLFVTDTFVFKYSIPNIDHLIIESNYDEKIVEAIQEKKGVDYVNKRRFKSHMSFQTTIETISKMDRSSIKNIVLIHLSDQVSNEREFKTETEQLFGIPTTVATSGQVVNFSKNPF
jgi:phosphoribosyl 1,2-cyclic phosphodiesterase